MAAIVTSLIAITLHYAILTDVAGALPMLQRGATDPSSLPPVIYNHTKGPIYITNHNDYYRLYCYGTEGARVTWSYNGQNISDPAVRAQVAIVEGPQFWEESANCLVIYDGDERHQMHGYMQCFVTNSHGSTFGDKVFITHAVLTSTGEKDTTIVATEGDPVTLSCDRYIYDRPAADITWEKDDQEIEPESLSGIFCNRERTVCVISHVKLADEARYKCIYHIPGKAQGRFKSFDVIVESSEYPDRVHPLNLIAHVSSPNSMKVKVGDTAELRCAFRGNMNKTLHWTRTDGYSDCGYQDLVTPQNNTLVNQKYTVESDGSLFRISNFSAEDQGYYLCIADNGYDQYSHRIKLEMVIPPVLAENIYGVQTYLEGTVRLNCSVTESIAPVSVTWYVNQKVVLREGLGNFRLEDDGAILALYNASLEDTSGVTCNVSNDVGSMLGYRYIVVHNITMATTETPTTIYTSVASSHEPDTTDPETTVHSTETSSTDAQVPVSDVAIATSHGTQVPDTKSLSEDSTVHENILTSQMLDQGDVLKGSPQTDDLEEILNNPAPTDPAYKLETGESGWAAGSKSTHSGHRLGKDSPWPWILIVFAVFFCGLAIGILGTRCYIYRRKAAQNEPSQVTGGSVHEEDIILNDSTIMAYNKQHNRGSQVICSSGPSETESMMHPQIEMETVT